MAPQGTRKRKSEVLQDAVTTPPSGPSTKKLKITQAQKQALIDNLQLESEFYFYVSLLDIDFVKSQNEHAGFALIMPCKQRTCDLELSDASTAYLSV